MSLGNRISLAIAWRNVPAKKLATLVGVSDSMIHYIRHDKKVPSARLLSDIASVLSVSVDFLLGDGIDQQIEAVLKNDTIPHSGPEMKRLEEKGLYLDREMFDTLRPIQSVLRAQASQENCDGEPYDGMVFAAAYIDHLQSVMKGGA